MPYTLSETVKSASLPLPSAKRPVVAGACCRLLYFASGLLAVTFLLSLPAVGQNPAGPVQPPGRPSSHQLYSDDPAQLQEAIRNHKMLAALNAQRQKSMISDANKLLQLAKELNAELASSESAAPSPEQMHKMAEIEKLARSVREKMSFAAGMSPALDSPFSVLQ